MNRQLDLMPQSRKSIWNTILQLQKETKMTVFLTTHYIEEAANSDYVVVMKDRKNHSERNS